MSVHNSAAHPSLRRDDMSRLDPFMLALWNSGLPVEYEKFYFYDPPTPENDIHGAAYPFPPFIQEPSSVTLLLQPYNPFCLNSSYDSNNYAVPQQQWSCEPILRGCPEDSTLCCTPLPSQRIPQSALYYHQHHHHQQQHQQHYQCEFCETCQYPSALGGGSSAFTLNNHPHRPRYQQQQQQQQHRSMRPSISSNIFVAETSFTKPSTESANKQWSRKLPLPPKLNNNNKKTLSKRHLCEYCDKMFARRHDLKRHTRLHTGAKPYKCPYCDMAFSRSDARMRHYKKDSICYEQYRAASLRIAIL